MKKLTTLVALLASIGFAYSQGTLNFVNGKFNADTNMDHNVYFDTVGGTPLKGTNYLAELYIMNGGSLEPLGQSICPFRVTTTGSPGTWNGKTITLTNLAGTHFGGVGVPLQVNVRVWDIKGGNSYEQAVASGLGKVGESGLFSYTQVASVPPGATDNELVLMPAFALVPEPSAIALGILGVAGLLIIRRRK